MISRRKIAIALVLGLSLRWACPPAEPGQRAVNGLAAERSDEIEAEVSAFVAHYVETLEGGDEPAIRELFVADDRFEWFTDGARSYASAEDVLAGMRRFAGVRFETTVSELRVVPLSESLASARSGFKTELSLPDGTLHEYGGVITWLVERDPEGGPWRVLLGHTSTPGGPPADEDDERR